MGASGHSRIRTLFLIHDDRDDPVLQAAGRLDEVI